MISAYTFRYQAKQSAFTLLEMLIVIALSAILLSIAIPSFKSVINVNRISSYTSLLHAALLFARSESIKRGVPVTICRSVNSETGNPNCATTNSDALSNSGWADGWIIFADLNNNGTYQPTNAIPDVLIQVQGKLVSSNTAGSIIPNPSRKFITFGATGQTFGTFLRFAINRPDSDVDASHDRFICISAGGRARVSNTLCSN